MTTAWLFPGQGSHSVGMLDAWTDRSSAVRDVLAEADQILEMSMSRLIADGPAEELNDTFNQQPALVVAGVAIMRGATDAGLVEAPRLVAGHSVGEFAALVASGALDFADALRLVRERARLMKRAGDAHPGGMAAILGLTDAEVESVVDGIDGVQVANYNAPGQVVVSGTEGGVERSVEALRAAGAKRVIPVRITVAAHSHLMEPAAREFARLVDDVPVRAARVPLVANVTARPATDADALRREMREQLLSSVRWTASVAHMMDDGVTTFLEMGPGRVLSGLVKRVARDRGATVQIVPMEDPPGSTA